MCCNGPLAITTWRDSMHSTHCFACGTTASDASLQKCSAASITLRDSWTSCDPQGKCLMFVCRGVLHRDMLHCGVNIAGMAESLVKR